DVRVADPQSLALLCCQYHADARPDLVHCFCHLHGACEPFLGASGGLPRHLPADCHLQDVGPSKA
ncbi:unnamed protein product, partial [Effrenium voratum]